MRNGLHAWFIAVLRGLLQLLHHCRSIVQEHRPIASSPDDTVEAGDELMLLTTPDQEQELAELLAAWRTDQVDRADQRG